MMKFTPEPLEFRTFDGLLPIVMRRKQPHGEADTFYTSLFAGNGPRVVELDWGYGSNRNEPYAHLFRAAPCLYAALEKSLADSDWADPSRDGMDDKGPVPSWVRSARAALEKANGAP